jgi:large subunit ribosomal protein L30e
MDAISEIKKMLNKPELILGSQKTIKELRKGTLVKVFLAQNPEPSLAADIESLARLGNVPVVKLNVPNDELGVACKKPFPISVIGLKKQ